MGGLYLEYNYLDSTLASSRTDHKQDVVGSLTGRPDSDVTCIRIIIYLVVSRDIYVCMCVSIVFPFGQPRSARKAFLFAVGL